MSLSNNPLTMIATLRAGSEVFHGDKKVSWSLRPGPVWATSSRTSALDYGPYVFRMALLRDARLFVFDSYEEAAKRLGVPMHKGASRDLVAGIQKLGVDGYWYQNAQFSDQEVMILDGPRFLTRPELTLSSR